MLSGKHRSIYQNFVFNPSISGCHAFENTYTSFIVESDERDKNKCIPHKENIIETNISREGDALCDFMYIVETKLSLEQIKNKINIKSVKVNKKLIFVELTQIMKESSTCCNSAEQSSNIF